MEKELDAWRLGTGMGDRGEDQDQVRTETNFGTLPFRCFGEGEKRGGQRENKEGSSW